MDTPVGLYDIFQYPLVYEMSIGIIVGMSKSDRYYNMDAIINQELMRLDSIKCIMNIFLKNDSVRHCVISSHPYMWA